MIYINAKGLLLVKTNEIGPILETWTYSRSLDESQSLNKGELSSGKFKYLKIRQVYTQPWWLGGRGVD